jgi:hypothetical protein
VSVFDGKGVFVGDVLQPNCAPGRLVSLLRANGFTYVAVKVTHGPRLENRSLDLKSWVGAMRDTGGYEVLGWGVHEAGGDQRQEAINVASRVQGFQLSGYIADLEDGFFYDGDTHGWGNQHSAEEQAAYRPATDLLALLRAELGPGLPLAVTTLVRKDYPWQALLDAEIVFIPQLYGASAAFPNADQVLDEYRQAILAAASLTWAPSAAAAILERVHPARWMAARPGEIAFLADAMNDDDFRAVS